MDLAQAVRDAPPHQTVKVPAGRYTVNLELTKPVTLLAMGQVVLDGLHAGSVVRVTAKDGVVRLAGLTIVGGEAPEAGGGVCALEGTVELSDCTLRFNKAPRYGGGALFVRDAKVKASRCRFEANTGRQGGAILVDGVGELRLEDSTVIQNAAVEGGGLRVKEAGRAELVGCTLADNKVVGDAASGGALHVSGTTTRAPTVTVQQCIVSERSQTLPCVFNGARHPGALSFSRSLLPPWCRALGGEQNTFADAGFVMSGSEPYLLAETSPAVGAADPATFPADARDVTGKPRVRGNRADLGAFAFVQGGSRNLPY